MIELGRLAIKDMDGDSKITGDGIDRIGVAFESHEGFVLAAGVRFVENQDNMLVCGLENPRLIEFIQHFTDVFTETGMYNSGNANCDGAAITNNGVALFDNPCTFSLEEYRDLPYDYGLLPMPKLDETQSYCGMASAWGLMLAAIPNQAADIEFSSFVLELMTEMGYYAWDEGVQTTYQAYIEDTLKGRFAPDAEDEEMVDLILKSLVFDMSEFYGSWQVELPSTGSTNSLGAHLADALYRGQTDFSSIVDSVRDSLQAKINETLYEMGLLSA
jgi:maltose-binding protein MalE